GQAPRVDRDRAFGASRGKQRPETIFDGGCASHVPERGQPGLEAEGDGVRGRRGGGRLDRFLGRFRAFVLALPGRFFHRRRWSRRLVGEGRPGRELAQQLVDEGQRGSVVAAR